MSTHKVFQPRAVFDLIKDFKEGNDKIKLFDKVIDLIDSHPEYAKRKFWDASFPYEYYGGEVYCDDEGTLSESIEGVASPLWMASGRGLVEIVEYLIDKHNADVNETWGIDCLAVSSLHHAMIDGHLECVQLLHRHGAELDIHDLSHGNAANVAVFSGNVELLHYVTDHGIGPVEDGTIESAVREPCNNFSLTQAMKDAIKKNQRICSSK
jgi:hypothetical protein